MKYTFSTLLFLHGAIHLIGFAKAFDFAPIENIHAAISKTSGVFWLLACALFLMAGIAFLAKADWWYLVSMMAVLLSTFLIISLWKDAKFGTMANIIILAGAIVGYGTASRLFFMKAVMKGLPVSGFHCFKNGDAFMDIRLLSLFKVQYQSGKGMGIAESVTFFNDMCCMAPATLIDKRIKWLDSDSTSANAEFSNNGISITARLFFNDKGELVNFVSDDRYAAGENNTMQRLRWSTPLKEYSEVDGYRLATCAAAVYTYPAGDLCYGTFCLKHITYNQ